MVYVIEAAGLVKIGTTVSIEERLSALRTGSPIPFSLLVSFPGDRGTEGELHYRFRDLRRHGEWFALEGELLDFIRVKQAEETARNAADSASWVEWLAGVMR